MQRRIFRDGLIPETVGRKDTFSGEGLNTESRENKKKQRGCFFHGVLFPFTR